MPALRNSLFLFLLFFSTCACARFSEVIYVSPSGKDIVKNGSFYEFENADILIRYTFWADNGIMGFVIYNKTSHPIYIDWKKSAMIYNGRQLPYYTNKTVSNYAAYGEAYGWGWAGIFGSQQFSVSAALGRVQATETIVKQERVTFIPPHAYISNAFYNLLSHIVFTIDKDEIKKTRMDDISVYVTQPRNPISFRNFIMYAASEDFAAEKYADNEFEISKIVTMNSQDFGSKDDYGYYYIISPRLLSRCRVSFFRDAGTC